MDAVEQIFAQARLGSAGGKGIESESLQGWVSLGQQHRRLALDEEEAAQTRQTRAMARDIFEKFRALKTTEERLNFIGSLAPLTLTRNGSQLVGVLQSITDKFEAIESQTMGRQVELAERKRAYDQTMRYGFTGPEATKRDEITALEKEVAALGGNPASLTYDDSLFNEQGYFLSPGTRQRLKSMAEPSLNLQQREEDALVRLQIAQAKGERQSPGMVAAQEIIEAQAGVDAAKRTGNPQAIQQAEQLLQSLKDAFPARGTEEIEMRMDDQGRPIFRMTKGGKGGDTGPTVATQSQAQQRIMAFSRTYQDIKAIKQSLRPEDLGIQGAIGEKIFDRVLAQYVPSLANDKRTDNRTKLKLAVEGMVRQVTNDPRFSNADRAAAKDALPSTGWADSHKRITQSLDTIANVFAKRAIIDAKTDSPGAPLPDWMIRDLSDEEIRQLNLDGIISKQEAINIYDRLHGTAQP